MATGDLVTLVSLGLTPLTVYAGAMVIYLWWHSFVKALKVEDRTAVNWMIIGVVINFIGGIADNLWWGFAWSADYVERESQVRDFLFHNGVYSNTLFRQGCGIIGALCHIQGGLLAEDRKIKSVALVGFVAGLVWIGLLMYARFRFQQI